MRLTTQSIRVRVVRSSAELALLADAWEALQNDARLTSVFQTFDWQYLWWATYGRGQPLCSLVAEEGERLVGLLPLYIQTVRTLRVPVRILRPVGIGGDTSPDDLGPVLARGCEETVAQAFAASILELPDWDVLQLSDLLPNSVFTEAIVSRLARQRLPMLTGCSERISYLELPPTWEAWLAQLSHDRRWRVRNLRKKVRAAHPTRFFVWDDADTLDMAIDRLVFLHNRRWNAVGKVHGFATPEYVGFHRAVMHACLRRDRLRLYCLEVAGQIIAMCYFYRFRDRIYLMQSGFDPDFSKLNPGQVLLHHIVEHAIGEGHQVLDFLRGDHRYKSEVATGERDTIYVTGFRTTLPAVTYYARRIVMPAAKARVLEEFRRGNPPPV